MRLMYCETIAVSHYCKEKQLCKKNINQYLLCVYTMASLTDLGRKYGTDKVDHQFTEYYDRIFGGMRDQTFNLLEVGVFFGSSVRMWTEYFQKATIYGADTFEGVQGNGNVFENPESYYKEWESQRPDRVELVKLDQSSKVEMQKFVDYCKNRNIRFKIIIDDGSHLMYDQQITFFYLWELLEDGGIFIMEDIHTSEQGGYDLNVKKTNSTKELFMRMKYNNEPFRSIYIDYMDRCNEITKEVSLIELHYSTPHSQTMMIRKK